MNTAAMLRTAAAAELRRRVDELEAAGYDRARRGRLSLSTTQLPGERCRPVPRPYLFAAIESAARRDRTRRSWRAILWGITARRPRTGCRGSCPCSSSTD